MKLVMAIGFPLVCVIEAPVILRIVRQSSDQGCQLGKGVYVQILPLQFIDSSEHLVQVLLRVEYRRLIHVIPEPVHTLIQQKTVMLSEPLPRLRLHKVRKMRLPGPDRGHQIVSVFILDEVTAFSALLTDIIAVLHLDARIDDRH